MSRKETSDVISNLAKKLKREIKKNLKKKQKKIVYKKKLVTRLPNFPDRRIRYEFYVKKNHHKRKNKFLVVILFIPRTVSNIRYNFSPAKYAPFCTYLK